MKQMTFMKQMAFATTKGFEVHGRATRKAAFLARMEALVPWASPPPCCSLPSLHPLTAVVSAAPR